MKVSELMSSNVSCCSSNDVLATAAQLMWDCDCGAVPVVDGENSRVVGMITDRDICMATWSQDRPPSQIAVRDAMSRELYTCNPGDSVAKAETLMREKQIRRLPVVANDGTLAGILSVADIVRNSDPGRPGKTKRDGAMGDSSVIDTLGVICAPRSTASATAAAGRA